MAFRSPPCARRVCLLITVCLLVPGPGCGKSESGTAPVTPSGAAPATSPGVADGTGSGPAPAAADGALAGLYVRQQMVPLAIGGQMTFNLRRDFFYFFPDGHMLFGIPGDGLKEHPTAADFAAFQGVAPANRGTWAVKDGQITMRPEKGEATTEPFSIPKPGDDGVLQIGPPSTIGSVKALPFKDGQTLDGSYEYDGTVGLVSGQTVFNVNTLRFRPDGTLGSNQLSGVDTNGIHSADGSGGVTTHSTSASAGTYRFSGYTLETNIGGKAAKATAFRRAGDDRPSTPDLVFIDGRVYSRR